MPSIETRKIKIAARLAREGWAERQGADPDDYVHPDKPGRIVVPRHRSVSIGGSQIARQAGWI